MRKIYILGAIIIAGAMTLGSCKKDDGGDSGSGAKPTIAGKNNQEIVMMQNWRWHDELDSAENGNSWTSNMLDCNRDDIYTFKTGGVTTVQEGAKDCDPGLPATYNSTWSMQNATSNRITIHTIQWEIKSQTAEEMVFERQYNPGSEDHTLRQTWKRD